MILEPTNISIDMIEISNLISPYNFERTVKKYIDSYGLDARLTYWNSSHWLSYQHNWKWENDGYTIFMAYKSNTGNDLSNNKFKIKWNPNKVDPEDELLIIMLNIFRYGKTGPVIEWFDVAFDYEGIATSDLILDKGKKKEWKIFSYPNSDLTYYIGKSGTNGSIKIYDKASEEIKKRAANNKTRYEVTIRDKVPVIDVKAWNCTTSLCKMYLGGVHGLYNDRELSPTEKLLMYAVENGFGLSNLTYEQRKRYEKIAMDRVELYTKIEPSQFAVEKALVDFVVNIFD